VHTELEGDAFFPVIDANHWQLVDREAFAASEANEFAFEFMTYELLRTAAFTDSSS
jgi:dihydrofolate reductase